ncbi:nectin-3-like protein isoform X4 [Sinocyclocheilus rhinocerous]|uniref:nectin-3-like protein isoform X4 n=1 Tax=Sinocyclocheilus rhinocerous TaxID=307959 RepID=UPI0007B9AE38|nr:PREDICTED: nectin-3-like protein isoform X4 [Sinocyclocheilus rhinocerous]
MVLTMTAHFLRNNPIHPGLNVRVLLMLSFVSGLVYGSQVVVPPKVNAVLGKNVTLSCRVQVDTNLSLTQSSWERKLPTGWGTLAVYNPMFGISITPEYERRLSFRSPSMHDATIVLEDVGFADIGIYTCKVATFPLGNTQASTTVSVIVEPKVYVSAGSSALIDGGNETTVATCIAERARPPADVSWETNLYGTSEAHMQDDANGTTTTQVHYTWQPSRHAQGHTLTCVVKHPALQSDFRIPYIINVQFAPDILVLGYDGNWYVGRENVQLKCRAKANPPAQHFRWIRLDGEMPGGAEVVNNSLAFMRPLQKNDSGVYRCEVANDIGLHSRDIRIRVQGLTSLQLTSLLLHIQRDLLPSHWPLRPLKWPHSLRLVGWRGAMNWLNGRQAGWLAETSRAPLTIHCPIRSGYVIRTGQTKFTSTIENTTCDGVLVSTAVHCQPQSENCLREYWEQNKITAVQ